MFRPPRLNRFLKNGDTEGRTSSCSQGSKAAWLTKDVRQKNMATISYQPFDDLISFLRADGLNQQADLLDYLIHKVAWTTGSELIGELGQKIKEIKKNDLNHLSAETKKNMDEGMDMVKVVWPDFPEN